MKFFDWLIILKKIVEYDPVIEQNFKVTHLITPVIYKTFPAKVCQVEKPKMTTSDHVFHSSQKRSIVNSQPPISKYSSWLLMYFFTKRFFSCCFKSVNWTYTVSIFVPICLHNFNFIWNFKRCSENVKYILLLTKIYTYIHLLFVQKNTC